MAAHGFPLSSPDELKQREAAASNEAAEPIGGKFMISNRGRLLFGCFGFWDTDAASRSHIRLRIAGSKDGRLDRGLIFPSRAAHQRNGKQPRAK